MLVEGARRSTLEEATDWTSWANKAVTFLNDRVKLSARCVLDMGYRGFYMVVDPARIPTVSEGRRWLVAKHAFERAYLSFTRRMPHSARLVSALDSRPSRVLPQSRPRSSKIRGAGARIVRRGRGRPL